MFTSFLKNKSHITSQNSKNQGFFYYFWLMIEGSVPLTTVFRIRIWEIINLLIASMLLLTTYKEARPETLFTILSCVTSLFSSVSSPVFPWKFSDS
jgi:hypothetical protein